MLFRITFRTLAKQAIAWFLRQPLFLRILYSAFKPLQTLNDDGVAVRAFGQENPSLFQLERFINNFVAFDARTIYLQKWLNDYYDPVKERIVINNNNNLPFQYIHNTAELATRFYMFNNWDSGTAYVASPEDYVHFKGFIWVSIANGTNKEPDSQPTFWTQFEEIEYFFNVADTFPVDYVVEIPIAVEMQPDYTTARIVSQINLFNAAGTTFEIRVV